LTVLVENKTMLDFAISTSIPIAPLPATSPLPPQLEQRAFCTYGNYAWRKWDLPAVFAYCIAASVAITDGEGWIVRRLGGEESISLSSHLAHNYVVYQVVPQRNGRIAPFSWHNCWSEGRQSWPAYVAATIQQAKNIIEQGQFETSILAEYAPHIYYKLSFAREDGLCF
jgi:hypothetical protein